MTIFNINSLLIIFLFIDPSGLSGQKSTNLIQPLKQDTIKQVYATPELITKQKLLPVSIEEYVQLNHNPPNEKIYLQLDRLNYMQGDTIWFKAYLWYGYDQLPDTISGVLYIDLLDEGNLVKSKRKLFIQNGISQGEFSLDTTIHPGRYIIRAYTRWMQNLNTGDPFYKTVTISPANQNFQVECLPTILKHRDNDSLKVGFRFFEVDQTGDLKNSFIHNVDYSLKIGDEILLKNKVQAENTKEQFLKYSLANINNKDTIAQFEISVNDDRITFKKQFNISFIDNIDVQFFPEGGNLMTGIESKVAFKATGPDGKSREVHGVIQTSDGEVVADFECSYKGMGAFMIKPLAGEVYSANLWYENRNYIIPLPASSEKGSVMLLNFADAGKKPYLSIIRTLSKINAPKYLVGWSNGKIWFSAFIKLMKDSACFQVPINLLPEGVCRLTLLNEEFIPECERLIYVDKNERFKIEVIPDSSKYSTRSKVTLLIKTTGFCGEPVQADLSLAVVDKEQINKETTMSGICGYKLLESELKGYIEDPDFYFKDDGSINFYALDLLLLTQGYRKFLPDTTKTNEIKFMPEKYFEISGKVKFGGSKSREKKFNYREIGLTLACFSGNFYIGKSNADSLGQFRFQIPLLSGKFHTLIQATNLKEKPLYGEIFLNDTYTPFRFTTPKPASYNIASTSIENVRQLQMIKKLEISKNPVYGLMSVNLPEVKVTARAKNWYRDFEPKAIKVADLDSLDPDGKKYETIFDFLIKEFGARGQTIYPGAIKTILLPCVSIGPDYWFPIFVVNGTTYFNGAEHGEMFLAAMNRIASFPINEIKKLMILPPGDIASYYADDMLRMEIRQSLVVIETYSNSTYRGNPQGIKTFIFDGLDVPRMFYSPRYDGPTKSSPIYDGRATLYWNSSIKTDSIGQAKIDFFTSDRITSLEVAVNGIELGNGYPGQKQLQINSASKNLDK